MDGQEAGQKKVVSPIISRLQGRGTDVMVSFLHLARLVQLLGQELPTMTAPQLYDMNLKLSFIQDFEPL